MDDDSQRGDTACGVSRTYLIREPFNQGKGCSEECTLGNAGMWPEPKVLTLVDKVLYSMAQPTFPMAALASPLISRKFQPKRTSGCSLCLLWVSCLCLPPTRPPARLTLSLHPKPPFPSRPSSNVTPPQASPSDSSMGDLLPSSCPLSPSLANVRSF